MGTSTGSGPTNRLADELSPYLLQHAHNPVDWYPWGDEALSRAKAEDKPILLSVGYSACHWCHVMERESFSDPAIAALMNELFVNIKVDREERPDLDQIYQLVVQLMRQSGGWPLTVFLTPDRKPFFAGTYFPPDDRHGLPSFRRVLDAAHDAYANRRQDVEQTGVELTSAIERVARAGADPAEPPPDAASQAARAIAGRFDSRHGGFGERPKFPNTMALDVLLRAARRGEEVFGEMVRLALDGMRDGGVHDQLGGGFHRYSTDERWLVPHFEKMLYDNALLARLYLDGWRVSKLEADAAVVRSTLGYVEREMLSPAGLFYSAQDADSEGEEGLFFIWRPEQLVEALGEDDAQIAALHWGVADGGNFEDSGATVLHVDRPPEAVAAQLGREVADVEASIARSRQTLLARRETREKPFRDEKHIATWNGLMVGAFAEAGAALREPRWVDVAEGALAAAEATLWSDGRLHRLSKDGAAKGDAFLGDYADLAGAALDVQQATVSEPGRARRWLGFARVLVDAALDGFWDGEQLFFTRAGEADVLVRTGDSYDNAVPSGTSSLTHALLRLATLTGESRYRSVAETVLRAHVEPALGHPMGFSHMVGALDRYVSAVELVVVADDPADAAPLLAEARRVYEPNLVLAVVAPGEDSAVGGAVVDREMRDGEPTAYVCRRHTCSAPVTDPGALRALLELR